MATDRSILDAVKNESPAFRILLVLLFVNMLVSGAALMRVSEIDTTVRLTCSGTIDADVSTYSKSSYIGGSFQLGYTTYVPEKVSGSVSLDCN